MWWLPGFLLLARTLPMPLPLLSGFLPFNSRASFLLARNRATPCLGREPKARVVTIFLESASKTNHKRLVSIRKHLWVLGQDTTFPHIVYFVAIRGGYIQMALSPGTPKLESRNCPETIPVGVPGLWELITPDCRVRSQRGLNQSCSSPRELSNSVSHSRIGCHEEVDSRLLVVGSQIANLTPGPSFAHNLGYKCPNDQCEAILEIYASKPFAVTPRTPQCEVFWVLLLNSKDSGVPEDSKSPTLGVWVSSSHLAKMGLRQRGCDVAAL
jgi:hypothetical protein